jgi:hypothetical protein
MGTEWIGQVPHWALGERDRERRRGGGRLGGLLGGALGIGEGNASFWADSSFSLHHDSENLAAQKQRRVWKIIRSPGSETVNPCARPIRLIRAVAMKRLFLEAF